MPSVVVGAIVAYGAAAVVSVGWAVAIGVAAAIAYDNMMDGMMAGVGGLSTANQELRVEANAAQIMIVGRAVTSGPITKYEKRTIDGVAYHLFFTPIAAHPCHFVQLYQLDGKSRSSLSGNGYRIIVSLGDQTEPVPEALEEMATIDNTFVGFGLTHAYHKYEINPDIFPNGVQDVKFLVNGIKVYDPRKDDTAGGSGLHRHNDESTWEWTDNAALINFHWKRWMGDIVLPIEMFDLQNIAFEANICDELVTFTDSNGDTQTEKRFTCNGVIDLTQGQRSVEEELLSSCGGRWIETPGKFYLAVAAYRGPASVTLSDDDLKGDIERNPFTPLSQRFNAITASFIDKKSFYQESKCPEISSAFYQTRDKRVIKKNRVLGYTDTATMCQRLNRIYMEQINAGDTLRVQVGWRGIKCAPGVVVNTNFKNNNIVGKEYEVIDYDFDSEEFVWTLTLKETGEALYDDTIVPSELDLLPNSTIDNTVVDIPNTPSYSETPNDSWRQGVITWTHPEPGSVRRYIVLLTKVPDDGWSKVYYPTEPSIDLNNLGNGDYLVAVSAENRFEKKSEAVTMQFSIGLPNTPINNVTYQILPGRVIINAPTPPNPAATYDWKISYQDDFQTAQSYGRNLTITVTPTQQDATLHVWYRVVDGDLAAASWVSFSIENLIGLSSGEVTPELISSLTLPGLPQTLLDTINGVTSDINNWSQQTGQLGGDYSTLLYNVTQATGAAEANRLDIIAVKELVGTTSVTAQITEFKNVQIGYEDEDTGEWVEGAAFAQAFNEVRITDADENELSIHQYFEALETRTGLLEGKVQLGITVEGSYTGIEILAGTSGLSSFRLFMDELVFASRAGEIAYEYLAAYGRHVWYGATVKIGATEMIVEDLEAPFGPDNLAYWRGPTTLNMGVPDFDNLTKANANEWRAPNGEWYRTGKATLAAPELTIVDSNGDPLIEYDSVADTIKNYGTFYAANIIGGLYGSINKTVTQPANAVTTTHQVFLTVTAAGQIVGGTFDRILKSEPLRLTWTSPNNVDTATFVVDVLVDGAVVATASQFATSPSGADMSVTFSMPAFLVDVPGNTSGTTIEFRISSTAATAGPTTITGQADGGVVNISVFKTDGSLT